MIYDLDDVPVVDPLRIPAGLGRRVQSMGFVGCDTLLREDPGPSRPTRPYERAVALLRKEKAESADLDRRVGPVDPETADARRRIAEAREAGPRVWRVTFELYGLIMEHAVEVPKFDGVGEIALMKACEGVQRVYGPDVRIVSTTAEL